MNSFLNLNILPRQIITWEEFLEKTPRYSIALDGVVNSAPRFDEETMHANFDHHSHVFRDATMSTAKQVYFAIKGGLMQSFRENGKPIVHAYVNDPDQDTSLAVWLLDHYKEFEGTKGQPNIHALLDLTDKLDITGAGFPINIDERLLRQHHWVFTPYTDLRKTGGLANANAATIQNCIEAICARVTDHMMGKSGEVQLDTEHEILYTSPFGYKIINEIGGTDARALLFSQGLDKFLAQIGKKADGKPIYTIGKRSGYVTRFPVPELIDHYNTIEGLTKQNGWGGSNLIGGSSRNGSSLSPEQLAKVTDEFLTKRYGDRK